MTLQEWLKRGEAQLRKGPHPDRARRDAEVLLQRALGLGLASLVARWKDTLADEQAFTYSNLLERRAAGEPIQYITGEAEFYRMSFKVTPNVLIPRPETEHLVEKATQLMPVFMAGSSRFFEGHRIQSTSRRRMRRQGDLQISGWPPRVLDVGTGSGAICIGIAHDWPEAEITATDISAAALEVAQSNAERLGFIDSIRFLRGDLLSPVAGERFEMIVSNPPYVAEAGRDSLAVEVREYEPPTALFAGTDGLSMYRRLIPATHAALVPGGYLLMEIGYGQSGAVGELLSSAGFEAIEFVPDLQGIPRVATASRP